jgi:hypothetical protein
MGTVIALEGVRNDSKPNPPRPAPLRREQRQRRDEQLDAARIA